MKQSISQQNGNSSVASKPKFSLPCHIFTKAGHNKFMLNVWQFLRSVFPLEFCMLDLIAMRRCSLRWILEIWESWLEVQIRYVGPTHLRTESTQVHIQLCDAGKQGGSASRKDASLTTSLSRLCSLPRGSGSFRRSASLWSRCVPQCANATRVNWK